MTWQLIETAPRDGSNILACALSGEKDKYFAIVHWDGYWALSECNTSHNGDDWYKTATHWMPLPPPPAINNFLKQGEIQCL